MDSKEGIQCNSPDENAERHKSSFFSPKKGQSVVAWDGGINCKGAQRNLLESQKCFVSWLCVHAKSLQSRLTLCDPVDSGSPGSSVQGILQARILEGVAMLSSRESSQLRDQTRASYVSCIGRQVLYHQHHPGSPVVVTWIKYNKMSTWKTIKVKLIYNVLLVSSVQQNDLNLHRF